MELTAQQRFLYEHEQQIRQWAEMLKEADATTMAWLREEMPRRLEALAEEVGASVAFADLEAGAWPRVMFYRPSWPWVAEGMEPAVSITWEINVGKGHPTADAIYVGARVVVRHAGAEVAARIRASAPQD